MKLIRKIVLLSALVLLSIKPCSAINLVIDYTHDSFFSFYPAAKSALEAAAADLSSAITTSLAMTHDTNTADVNNSFATFNFNFTYTHPATGALQTINSAVVAANEVRVYAGVRNLTGNTLGVGGPGGAGYHVGGSYFDFNDFAAAVSNAAIAGSNNMKRGGGPVIGNLSGAVDGIPISVDYGSSVGSIWFDRDTNNDGVIDSEAVLNANWHFDHATPVASGKSDFYSVALHELLHAVGIGTAKSWTDKVAPGDSRDWTGAQAIALIGTGDNVLQSGSSHIAEGQMSVRVSDGGVQEAAMDPTITVGTRKELTNLDLAFLRDIGWNTINYYSAAHPGDFDLDGDVDGADFVAWQTNFPKASGATLAQGDADGDGDVDGADFVVWQTNFPFSPGPGASPVPEPAAWFLAVAAFSAVVVRRSRG